MIQGDSKLLVNQGVAGTGAAVIYDTNKFNPVQFAEDLVSNIRAEKNKKIAEREKQNKALATSFENPYNGALFQTQLIDEVKAAKDKFTKDPTLINQLHDPTSALGQEFETWKLDIDANANIAKGAEDAYNKDLAIARAKNASGAIDPLTFENLKKISQMSYKDAAKFYQENGTAIVPAADIEDLMTSISYTPTITVRPSPEGRGLMIQSTEVDDKALRDDILAAIRAPQNAQESKANLRAFGGDENKLADEMIRQYKKEFPKDKVIKELGVSAGPSNSAVYTRGMTAVVSSNPNYASADNGRKNFISYLSQGQDLKPFELFDEYGQPVYSSLTGISVNPDDSGEIYVKTAKRSGATVVSEEEARNRGYAGLIDLGTAETGPQWTEFKDLETRVLPLNETNRQKLIAVTNIDPIERINKENNATGKNVKKKEAKGGKKTISAEEFKKLSPTERMKLRNEGVTVQ